MSPVFQNRTISDYSSISKPSNWKKDENHLWVFENKYRFTINKEFSRYFLKLILVEFPWENPPLHFSKLAQEITDSKWMLELEENWNEEGALPVSKNVWERASMFLWNHAEALVNYSGLILDTPDIAPNPDGGIGFYWKTGNYELLINVPSNSNNEIGYYGDDRNWSNRIKGKTSHFTIDKLLIAWFTLAKSNGQLP
jgi:hypothetical protein